MGQQEEKSRILSMLKQADTSERKPGKTVKVKGKGVSVGQFRGVMHLHCLQTCASVPLSDSQRARLTELRERWVSAHNATGDPPLTSERAQQRINQRAGVTHQEDIPSKVYADLERWLLRKHTKAARRLDQVATRAAQGSV